MSIDQADKEKSLDYWNAVEGWVELPKAEQPTGWVYPEGLEALQQGQPWTAFGTDGNGPNSDGVERIPLYTSPQPQMPWVGLTEEEVKQIVDENTLGSCYQFWCSGKGVAEGVEAKLREKTHMSDKDIGGPVFQENELYVLQMAAISTASFGYWKEGDDIHPDYDTTALRDVAKLYAKYDALYKKQQPAEWVGLTDEEVEQVFPAIATYHAANKTLYRSIARAIEAKLKEKNNG